MNILVLSFSTIARDPRVGRQIEALEDLCRLTVAGFGEYQNARCEYIQLTPPAPGKARTVARLGPLPFRLHDRYTWEAAPARSALGQLQGRRFEAVIANDVSCLPLALRIADGAPVICDAHEFSPREFEQSLPWRLTLGPYYDHICRTFLPRTAGMTTVCEGIAAEYEACYGVRPLVLTNAPYRQKLDPAPVNENCIRMIHHGAAIPSRRLEAMIAVMDGLDDRFTLDFMLMPNKPAYLAKLKRLAHGNPRIRFISPVPMKEICTHIVGYDIGLYLLEPQSFNDRHALPNKFFEFIQARLALAIGPSPEMAAVVRRFGLGIVADSFDPATLRAELNALDTPRLRQFKEAAHRAAGELCYEANRNVLLAEIRRVTGVDLTPSPAPPLAVENRP